MISNISHHITLNDGNTMPLFGLGCWDMYEDTAYKAVLAAISEGYRMFDTAEMYENECPIGNALRDSGLKRDEYFVVTKLDASMHGYEEAKKGCLENLERLGMDYVDLFLIHTPRTGRVVDAWKALVELKKEGKTKSIGVSNFSGEHIEGLMKHGMEKPAVNQIEIHPLHQEHSTISYCRQNNIAVMAYCPLARGTLFKDGRIAVVDSIASKLNKTKAQVFIRWSLQNNVITIPKSANPGRIKENAQVFDWSISDADMDSMATLNEDLVIDDWSEAMLEPWSSFKQ